MYEIYIHLQHAYTYEMIHTKVNKVVLCYKKRNITINK
jgi:hypothetical protein